jgi:hypothetical protein
VTEETYYFNGIRVNGEYGIATLTPHALVEKLNEDENARFEEIENLKAGLRSSRQDDILREELTKLLYDFNQQTLEVKLTTQDAWLEGLAHELSVLILGEANVKPGNVKDFAQRLKADPWETLQNVITLVRMKNESLLAELLLSISPNEATSQSRKRLLQEQANHALIKIDQVYLQGKLAATLVQDRKARAVWLDNWLHDMRSLQIDSLKTLHDLRHILLELLETLIRALLHPTVPLTPSSSWFQQLAAAVNNSEPQAQAREAHYRHYQVMEMREVLAATPAPDTTAPTASAWRDGLVQALIDVYLHEGSISWFVVLETLQTQFTPLLGELGDAIAWENLLLILRRGFVSPNTMPDIPLSPLRMWVDHLDPERQIDPTNLQQAGWGIVFPQEMDAARLARIKVALEPLLRHRLIQTDLARLNLREDVETLYARSLDDLLSLRDDEAEWLPNWYEAFWIYDGPLGYRPGDAARQFMQREPRHADPSRLVDPERGNVPYYLLLVGSPEEIPFAFSQAVNVQFAVGRLDFGDDYDAYRRYAEHVVAAERGQTPTSNEVTFFAVQNPGDRATQLSQQYLAQPLRDALAKRHAEDWTFSLIQRREAKKARFLELLQQVTPPAFLFTTSHGLEFAYSDPWQREHQEKEQGALICGDWPAGRDNRKVEPQHYVTGEDVRAAPNLNVRGMMAFFFACYSAGTPLYDEYSRQKFKNTGEPIAARPFVADLPKALLENGALAVVGHIERAWALSFLGEEKRLHKARQDAHTSVFESALDRLLNGHPIGSAMDYISTRYAALAMELLALQEQFAFTPDAELAQVWLMHNDARGYVIIGDPAVRVLAAIK